jgi:hypothetical protein
MYTTGGCIPSRGNIKIDVDLLFKSMTFYYINFFI